MIPLRDHLFSLASIVPPPRWQPVPLDPALLRRYPLRDYQIDIVLEVIRLMMLGYRRILIQLATGGGKTILAQAILGIVRELGYSGRFIVHRDELIKQTSNTFTGAGLDHGFIASGRPMAFEHPLTIAGVQTLVRRLDLALSPDVLMPDECHHGVSASWAKVLNHNPSAFIVGLTATPERLDGRGMAEIFEAMVCGPSTAELIDMGFLSPFDYYAPHIPDLTGVASQAGDYARAGVAEVMDKPRIIGDIVEHYLTLGAGLKGIGFAPSREYSRKVVDAFNGSGVRAMHIDGDSSDDERDYADAAYREGAIQMLSNVGLLGEGYDVPDASYLGDWAPTKSLINFLQRDGRVLRIGGADRAVIADHAGNCFTHGLPDDEREWSLEGRTARLSAAGGSDATPVRQCLTCYRVSPSIVMVCPGCGTEFPSQARQVKEEAGTLSKVEREMLKRKAAALRKAEERACDSEAALVELAKARGYKNPQGWARMRLRFRNNYRGG